MCDADGELKAASGIGSRDAGAASTDQMDAIATGQPEPNLSGELKSWKTDYETSSDPVICPVCAEPTTFDDDDQTYSCETCGWQELDEF